MLETDKKLLILDLDETLLFGTVWPLARKADFVVGPYFIYKRPHVDAFLAQCLDWFDVAVWTSAAPSYAARIVQNVFPAPDALQFVWASDRCTLSYDMETGEQFWVKNLKKVKQQGRNLEQVLVVDDTPEKHGRNYGNLVRVRPFTGDTTDDELPRLAAYLNTLRGVPNVRAIEKRHWRTGENPP